MSSKSLVPVSNQIMSMQDTMQLGKVFAESGFFADSKSAAQAVVKILAGRELGFGPMSSMTGIHIIEGKPSIGAHLLASAIKRSDLYDYSIVSLNREQCELEFFEMNNEQKQAVGKVLFTFKDAVESGLALDRSGHIKANWKRFTDDMLFARAISKGYKRFCPDLTGGMVVYTDGEIEIPLKNAEPGDVIDAEYTVEPPKPVAGITPEQVAEIEREIEWVAANRQALLNFYKVRELGELIHEQYTDCLDKLAKKKSRAAPPAETGTVPPTVKNQPINDQQKLVLINLAGLQGLTAETLAKHLGIQTVGEIPTAAYHWLRCQLEQRAELPDVLKACKVVSICEINEKLLPQMTQTKVRERIDFYYEKLGLTGEQWTKRLTDLFGHADQMKLNLDQLVQLETKMAEGYHNL